METLVLSGPQPKRRRLFDALPAENLSGKERKVFLVGNPGTETCDPSPAETKGWTVDLTTDW